MGWRGAETRTTVKKVGNFWLPDVDLRWGKRRRKSLKLFRDQDGPDLTELEQALERVQRWTVAIDGGANVGAHSRFLAQRFEKVYGFEPAPDTYQAFVRNVEDWNLGDRVVPLQQALSDRVESVSLGGAWRRRSLSRRVTGGGSIACVRIDDLGLTDLAFMKLDLEGYEERALRGAQETIRRFKPVILFEDKPHKSEHYGKPGAAHELLQSLGAKCVGCIGPKQIDWLYEF
jgi:FkbM family methyltransferase